MPIKIPVIEYLSDDVRGLQFPYCFDVLLNGSVVVPLAVEMVPVLPEDVNQTIVIILLTPGQTEKRNVAFL